MESLLNDRTRTHGHFVEQFRLSQELKEILRQYNWNKLSDVQKEALEMIVMKISRIVTGDPTHDDHWTDIAGYAKRANTQNRM